MYFLAVVGLKVQDQISRRVWFMVRVPFLPYRQPPSCYILRWQREQALGSLLLIRVPVLSDQGSNLMTSFNLSHLLKDPSSNIATGGLYFNI